MTLPSATTALLLLLLGAIVPAAAQDKDAPVANDSAGSMPASVATGSIVIPNFWDPRSRIDQPPPGAVVSLRFITTDDFPPFNFLDANGQLTGFNIDLARAICAELEIPCTIQARAWDRLIDRLNDGTADAIIAGHAITEQSREQLDFSDVYLRVPARFVAAAGKADLPVSPSGLRGRTLAVVARTAHEAYLAAMFPEVARKLYPNAEEALAAIVAGDADAHFGDGLQLSFWLQSEAARGCCVFIGGPYLETRFFGQGYAIAVAKSAGDIRLAINAALAAVFGSGRYAELYLRYFPTGLY
ncbi:MAG: transporter substrate-binding domain-containing protein [Alphaproteobacteria bacterium]